MALTFTVSGLTRDVTSVKRVHRGSIALSGTNTAAGDAVTPAMFGLSVLEKLILEPAYNGTLLFQGKYVPSTGKVIFFGTNATPGAAVADPEVTAGTSFASYVTEFEAVGR